MPPELGPRLAAIDDLLDGAACHGAELDLRYRVLGLTIEASGREGAGDGDHTMLQVLFHPCNDIQARLVRDGSVIERFEHTQLPLVVDRLGGPRIDGPVIDAADGLLTGDLSLRGKADVTDGRSHLLALELAGDSRVLELRLRFDTAEVRDADGEPVEGLGPEDDAA